MTTLDLLILLVIGIGLARGVATGAIRQASSLIGLLLAFVIGVQLMDPAGYAVADTLGVPEQTAPVVGFVLVFIAIQIAVFVVARMLERVIGALGLGIFNRLGGGALGGLKAALLLSVLFLVLNAFAIPGAESRRASELYAPVATLLPRAWDFATEQWPRAERLYDAFEAPDSDDQ